MRDPEDVFDRQVEFIQECAIPIAMVDLLQALPGTQLYRRLVARALIENTENELLFSAASLDTHLR